MKEKLQRAGIHALLSVLLSVGLSVPVLGILDPMLISSAVLLPLLLTVLLFELASLHRAAAFSAAGAVVVGVAVWIAAFDGFTVLSDVLRASLLRFSGEHSAVPLVASQVLWCYTVVITLVSCFACLKDATCIPSVLLCIGAAFLIYLSGSARLTLWLLPALAAMLLILFTDRFPETPLLPLLPWVAALVALSLLIGFSGVGIPSLREKTDEWRQSVLDRLFFTEPRDVFSLSSQGYYPEGMTQLGGKPEPRDVPVMQVSSPRTTYLRGVVLNEYNGRCWTNTTGGRRYLWQSPRYAEVKDRLFDESLPAPAVQNTLFSPAKVSVRMLSDGASTLFVPQRVRELSPGGDMVPYFSNSSEIFITRNLQAGDTYAVTAPLLTAGDPGISTLLEACRTMDDPAWDSVIATYTALPAHLEQPVYDLAREVSSAGITPYDKAMAIQSWLNRSFRYTLDVDEQPENIDFVTRFLLDTKEGYCTYFASAMTVLCRMAGLPARYVEGFLAVPDENGEALVTGLSAHAWTEVYFHCFGWLTFDATPRTRNEQDPDTAQDSRAESTPDPGPSETPTPTPPPADSDAGPEDTPSPVPDEPSPSPSPSPTLSPQPSSGPASPPPESGPEDAGPPASFPWLWLLLLLLLAALLVLRILLTSPSFRSRFARSESERLNLWTQEIFDLLAAENFFRRPDESPMGFLRRVDQAAAFDVSLGTVGECISLMRYAPVTPQQADTALVRDAACELRKELSRPGRARYFLRRLFLSLKRRAWTRIK